MVALFPSERGLPSRLTIFMIIPPVYYFEECNVLLAALHCASRTLGD
jgi:hypothetical protein